MGLRRVKKIGTRENLLSLCVWGCFYCVILKKDSNLVNSRKLYIEIS
jgi:hypothetical protein